MYLSAEMLMEPTGWLHLHRNWGRLRRERCGRCGTETRFLFIAGDWRCVGPEGAACGCGAAATLDPMPGDPVR